MAAVIRQNKFSRINFQGHDDLTQCRYMPVQADGAEWQRPVQSCHRLLQQEQEEDKRDQHQDREVEPRLRRGGTGSKGVQRTGKGRNAEQDASKPAEGGVAGNVTVVQGFGTVMIEDLIEAMYRTESVQVATRQRGAGAIGSEQYFMSPDGHPSVHPAVRPRSWSSSPELWFVCPISFVWWTNLTQ